MATATNPLVGAQNNLWHALEQRRQELNKAGLKFSSRQYAKMAKAHADGGLIAWFIKDLAGTVDQNENIEAMARAMKAGVETWEHVLIDPTGAWAGFVPAATRQRCSDVHQHGNSSHPVRMNVQITEYIVRLHPADQRGAGGLTPDGPEGSVGTVDAPRTKAAATVEPGGSFRPDGRARAERRCRLLSDLPGLRPLVL
jgi:hypothetical protein